MSFVRTFTTRRNKPEDFNIHMGRAASQRAGKPVLRAQISSPVALVSTTNPLSYDAPSIENSPISTEPEPNHLSCYFKPAVDTTSHDRSSTLSSRPASVDAPAIPQRVPSHSKRAHEQLHRKRSVQRMMSPPARTSRNSADMFNAEPAPENPFGSELAQLDEVQEELSHAVRDAERDADAAYMEAHGFAFFEASDYLSEIHSLLYDVYLAEETVWI